MIKNYCYKKPPGLKLFNFFFRQKNNKIKSVIKNRVKTLKTYWFLRILSFALIQAYNYYKKGTLCA